MGARKHLFLSEQKAVAAHVDVNDEAKAKAIRDTNMFIREQVC